MSETNRFSSGVGMRWFARSARSSDFAISRFTPRPVFAEIATTSGRSRSRTSARSVASSRSVRVTSHLFIATIVAAPFFIASSAIRRSSLVSPSWASQTRIATSARSAARSERICA